MTRTSGGDSRVLKDVNGNISDHLQNHIHLTNCIHLKNHLHKHTPFTPHTTLLRDLVLLQKSRRLRDPIGFDHLRECTRLSGSSAPAADPPISTKSSDDQAKNWTTDDGAAALPCNRELGRRAKIIAEEAAATNTVKRGERRRRFRSARRNRPSLSTRDAASAKANSFVEAACDDRNGSSIPGNRCGIPWNWSRIHHRGKSFLDMAGRSLSRAGLSESRLKKEGSSISDVAIMSDPSSSSTVFGREAFPLLLDASASQGSINDRDYSGELGIFADNLPKQETDSDLASEVDRVRRQCIDRQHQNLTQKYMPRTFNDLVGQNLVVQALSNAVTRKKIGSLYVFYGPHGTGKTTCARIFARALNCQSLESPKPCGFCDSCIAYDKGKSRNVKEIGPVSKIDYESVIELLENNHAASQFGVFIFDECDAMTSDCWSAVLRFIYRSPRRVVIILVCSSLDALPHVIVSRCQKFCFTKLRDADIVYALQLIASKEDLEIDRDALKLIASRSDGSLRDAEMTLEQLSLLGQKISLCLVQELVGLISDEKLLDLLDFALSADTINTVRNLRDIMASGIEPLALMSQLATVITDILAGSYDDTVKDRPKRKFFQRQDLSKEDMEKLRQALKTLSEAEKQLRVSSERMTWLTAALLQLAPDQHYTLPASSADTTTSSDHSPIALSDSASRVLRYRKKINGGDDTSTKMNQIRGAADKFQDIWVEVLENIKIKSLKEFMYKEAKIISLTHGAAPTVQLLFNSQLTKSVVEKFRPHILKAFETVLGSPVITIEIRQGSRQETGAVPILLRGLELFVSDEDRASHTSNGLPMASHSDIQRLQIRDSNRSGGGVGSSEIVEVEGDSQSEYLKSSKCKNGHVESDMQNNKSLFAGTMHNETTIDQGELSERNHSLSIVRRRVSLAHMIQHVDGLSKRHALEQENLRLEPRSRKLLCWNPPRISRPKLSCLKFRRRKTQTLRKLVSCGRCLSATSPNSQVVNNTL
ncbi:AAA-type ATPase family protein [Perilla frutescens var. frutescens]|nr:AAA-type ATPase family protein [Perilla frutescens var. frutescens]